ncbi:Roadblock/LC7 family protein [Chloroherpeton thalassium ATCC 35110]|uniref:Roadblock/LC7 family protein n=1 Tax=Chloroherpeton thalassium (strain ATCC 35110 / GB-78) TaxID=517418 RepID=B3QU74_CHLT3|nr:roadblock/LC7 domain-containing protein [Chloroherpeton thalassium]ACF12872.1 Roadblock/LC7 family protein [Chloroherpeton thalassium ATCC 35110]
MRLRSGISIDSSQHKKFEQVLENLLQKAPAKFILLTDVSGQVVSACGPSSQFDLIALGSVMAGGLSAAQEVAQMLGGEQEYQLVLHEGLSANTFMAGAGPDFAILVQLDKSVPLGWARMLIQEAAKKIDDNCQESDYQESSDAEQIPDAKKLDLLGDPTNLSDQIGDSLDALWKG